MSATVNNARPTLRQEQADATRERIATAAQRLFAAHGYAATSMQAIAVEARVAPRTVYASFGAKREILSAICERWLERADARERAREVLARPDPADRLRGAAAWLVNLYATDFDVVRILDAAMDEDAETRKLLRAKLRGRNRVMDQLIGSLGDLLVVPLADAQASFRAYAATGVYQELVISHGWSRARFESWLYDALATQLTGAR